MMNFASLAHLARHLERIASKQDAVDKAILTKSAIRVERRAKSKIGDYQQEQGPFEAWRELAESTQADRRQQGYNEDDPLLRTGALRDSIQHVVEANKAVVGSASEIAMYQETGTPRIPPRSFLGGSAAKESPAIIKDTGRIAFRPFQGKPIPRIPDNV